MKNSIFITCLATMLFVATSSTAQTGLDSIVNRSLQVFSKNMMLSDSILALVKEAKKSQLSELASINNEKPIGFEERGNLILNINTQFEQRLKSILTTAQWELFLQMKESTRQQFLQKMRSKNITVKEL